MSPLHLLAGLVAGSLILPAAAATRAATPPPPPNVIYVLADDLGYGDLGSYGQQLIRTPRLDRMAQEGMRFTQHYAGAASCAPSRSVLMTGLHTGHTPIRALGEHPLAPEDRIIPEVLRAAGYRTGVFGKWGLGIGASTGAPWRQGVDEFYGYLDHKHAHTYYPEFLWRNDQREDIPGNRGGARQVYSHDLIVDAALDFIRQHRDRPFFLYGAFTIPHAEVAVPEDSAAEYRGRWPEPKAFPGSATYAPQKEPRAIRAAMITRLDRDMGRILDLLEELGISERTLVMFSSDNGPITAGGQDPDFFGSRGSLRGLKFTLYEAGIRVPFLARWSGRIPAGVVSPQVSDFADILPTLAEFAGTATPAGLDGVSLVPTLTGAPERQVQRPHHYWEAAPQQAVRRGDWKLYRPAPDRPGQLYHLGRDIGEQHDVAAQHPELVAELTQLLSRARTDHPLFPLVPAAKR